MPSSGAMKAALLVESLTGNTWKAAEVIGSKLTQERWSITGLSKVGSPDLASVEEADIVLIGTWTHGFFVVGQMPWALGRIANLPTMRGKTSDGKSTLRQCHLPKLPPAAGAIQRRRFKLFVRNAAQRRPGNERRQRQSANRLSHHRGEHTVVNPFQG